VVDTLAVPPNVLLDTPQITDAIEKRVNASTKPAPSLTEALGEVVKIHPSTYGVLHALNERITVRWRSPHSDCPRVQAMYTLEVTRRENDRGVLTFGVSSQYFNRLKLRCTRRTASIHCQVHSNHPASAGSVRHKSSYSFQLLTRRGEWNARMEGGILGLDVDWGTTHGNTYRSEGEIDPSKGQPRPVVLLGVHRERQKPVLHRTSSGFNCFFYRVHLLLF
jgi:hypothetical protein